MISIPFAMNPKPDQRSGPAQFAKANGASLPGEGEGSGDLPMPVKSPDFIFMELAKARHGHLRAGVRRYLMNSRFLVLVSEGNAQKAPALLSIPLDLKVGGHSAANVLGHTAAGRQGEAFQIGDGSLRPSIGQERRSLNPKRSHGHRGRRRSGVRCRRAGGGQRRRHTSPHLCRHSRLGSRYRGAAAGLGRGSDGADRAKEE